MGNVKDKIKDVVSIKMIMDGFGVLQRNGFDLTCPFVQPMTIRQRVPSKTVGGQEQEQVGIQKTVCNTGCPHFLMNDNDTITLACGSGSANHKIEKVIDVVAKEEGKDSKIIPLNNK